MLAGEAERGGVERDTLLRSRRTGFNEMVGFEGLKPMERGEKERCALVQLLHST